MAIEREIWQELIIEALYADNQFLNRAYNADQYVLIGKVVHIPQAGAPSGAERNRSSLPATVTKRTDVDITYALDEITTNPVLIPNIDTLQLSYDKVRSVVSQDMQSMVELAANWMLRKWAPAAAGSMLRTTGADRTAEVNGTATGNRKKFTKDQMKLAQKMLNKQNVSKNGRVALLPSEFLSDLMDDVDLIKRDTASEVDFKNGIVARLFGFEVMERSEVLTYTNATTPVAKDPGAAGATTDNAAALLYHPNFVERALGTVDTFERLNDPTYYGDIYSFLMMLGGRIRRNDNKGVITVIEAAGS
jgi:hypothetical protein